MKIGLRGGHSLNCRGAVGLRDEYDMMQQLYKVTKDILEKYGHIVVDCNSNASSANSELQEGARKANNANVDIFISLHMNSFNGQAHGTEALVAEGARKSIRDIAQRLCNNYASLGLTNRGVKTANLYEMRNVNAPNIIFETLFCDNAHDINEVWSPTPYEKLARYIANAIDPNISLEKEQDYYRVCVQRFTNKEDAEKAQQRISNELGYYCFTEKI